MEDCPPREIAVLWGSGRARGAVPAARLPPLRFPHPLLESSARGEVGCASCADIQDRPCGTRHEMRRFPHQRLPRPVAAVSERLAQRLWPGQNPIGRQFREGDNPPLTVIGVVGEVRNATLETEPTLQYYRPAAADIVDGMSFVIRTRVPPESAISEVRRAVTQTDPEQPLAHVRTMQEILSGTTLSRRFETWLLASFATVALFLSVLGVFGVLSLSVARRAREFGIRVALGATHQSILRLVMGEATRLIATGVVAGVVLAMLSRRFLSGLLGV